MTQQFLGIYPKQLKRHKNLYINIHSNIFHDRQKMRECKCPWVYE